MKRLRPIFKQFVSFYQVINLFGSVYRVQYPQKYLDFLAIFAVVNFDFPYIFRLDCIEGYTWHATLYTTLCMFAALSVAQAILLFVLEVTTAKHRELPRGVYTAANAIVLLTYVVYPGFSNTLFQCTTLPVKFFPSISCHNSIHGFDTEVRRSNSNIGSLSA